MNFKFLFSAFIALIFCASAFASQETKTPSTQGIVNFATCMSDSKQGKQEQASFEALKNQMTALLEDTEKQITDLSIKFNDSEYMDGLSPEAEEEMKTKFRSLNEEMNRYQNQYYQVLNQANMKIIQSMGASIQDASEKVAKSKKLATVLNKEACFFYIPSLDITTSVIGEMDKVFDQKTAPKVKGAENIPASSAVK